MSDQTTRRLEISAELVRITQALSEAWDEYARLESFHDFYNMNLLDEHIQYLEREYEDAMDALYSE